MSLPSPRVLFRLLRYTLLVALLGIVVYITYSAGSNQLRISSTPPILADEMVARAEPLPNQGGLDRLALEGLIAHGQRLASHLRTTHLAADQATTTERPPLVAIQAGILYDIEQMIVYEAAALLAQATDLALTQRALIPSATLTRAYQTRVASTPTDTPPTATDWPQPPAQNSGSQPVQVDLPANTPIPPTPIPPTPVPPTPIPPTPVPPTPGPPTPLPIVPTLVPTIPLPLPTVVPPTEPPPPPPPDDCDDDDDGCDDEGRGRGGGRGRGRGGRGGDD
jgi:hypothetical protein